MEQVHAALAANPNKSQQVEDLLQLLADSSLHIDVCLCSFGGVGSSELSAFLNRLGLTTNLQEDKDSLKHAPRPPAFSSPQHTPRHVVYLYGDPLTAVASHYRRAHAFHQATKTNRSPLSPATFPPTFEQYMHRQEDLFGLESHFMSWLTDLAAYDITFIRYEKMFEEDVASKLLHRLCGHKLQHDEIEAAVQRWVASKRERKSQVTPEQKAMIYVETRQTMDLLPPVFIRKGGGAVQPL